MKQPFVYWLLAVVLVSACATLGDEAAFPDPVDSALAPFRSLTELETGKPSPESRVITPDGGAFDRGMRTLTAFWYAEGALLMEPPDRDETLPSGEVDWRRFEPRTIRRATPEQPTFGFARGDVVYEATAAWQGGEVFDPWVIERADGATLYYASAGGLGVATGPASGPFTGDTLLLADASAPSVVEFEGTTWLFFERAGVFGAAILEGDVATVMTEPLMIASLEPGEGEPAETRQRNPAAVVYTSSLGRQSIRLYFGVELDDGKRRVGVAGSGDGVEFERFDGAVWEDVAEPTPFLLPGMTFLYGTLPFHRGSQFRALVAGVTPARTLLVEEPVEP